MWGRSPEAGLAWPSDGFLNQAALRRGLTKHFEFVFQYACTLPLALWLSPREGGFRMDPGSEGLCRLL